MNRNEALIALSESNNVSFGTEPFPKQSVPQKVFSAIWELEGEVNNGGFQQYFANSFCESAHFVVEALEKLNAPQTADICKRALRVAFPKELPSAPSDIAKAARNFSPEVAAQLNDLTQEFFGYPNNLTDLLFEFVKKYPDEFGPLPDL